MVQDDGPDMEETFVDFEDVPASATSPTRTSPPASTRGGASEHPHENGIVAGARSFARSATAWMNIDITDVAGSRRVSGFHTAAGGGATVHASARTSLDHARSPPRPPARTPPAASPRASERAGASGASLPPLQPGASTPQPQLDLGRGAAAFSMSPDPLQTWTGFEARAASVAQSAETSVPNVPNPSLSQPSLPQGGLSLAMQPHSVYHQVIDAVQEHMPERKEALLSAMLPLPEPPMLPPARALGHLPPSSATNAERVDLLDAEVVSRCLADLPSSGGEQTLHMHHYNGAGGRASFEAYDVEDAADLHHSLEHLGSYGSDGKDGSLAAPLLGSYDSSGLGGGQNGASGTSKLFGPARVMSVRMAREMSSGGARKAGSVSNDITLGLVNVIVALPCTVAFASIVYRHAFFVTYLPALSRLMYFANGLHQLVFCFLTGIPAAVGQVQDVGLIFMNAMTSDIVRRMRHEDDAKILATCMLTTAVSTAIVGLWLIVIGRLRLTRLVLYVPLPVIASYLGYVGYFCFAAGIAQSTSLDIGNIATWVRLFSHPAALPKVIAAVAVTVAVALAMRRGPVWLPSTIVVIPIVWYCIIGVLRLAWGWSGEQMHDALVAHAWVSAPLPGGAPQFWEIFEMFNLVPFSIDNIGWFAMARQFPTLIALCLVCGFGTAMDLVAVQSEMPDDLDSSAQAQVVGISNVAAGVFGGGGTGSYIFSQTVLALRANVTTRGMGLTIALGELAAFLLPVNLVQYLPNFYYGGLLMVFGVEIVHEWLISTAARVTRTEFIILWCSFLGILTLTVALPVQGLEAGMLMGIVLCALHFAAEYAHNQVTSFSVVPSRANSLLPYRYQQVMQVFHSNVVAVSVSGYIFFGSMVPIGDRVRALAAELTTQRPAVRELLKAAGFDVDSEPGLIESASKAISQARRFLLLDLRSVSGIDATTASAFASLRNQLSNRGVTMVLTGVTSASVHKRLAANGVISADGSWEGGERCPAFGSMDAALVWAEEHFKAVATMYRLAPDLASMALTLENLLLMHLNGTTLLEAALEQRKMAAIASSIEKYMTRKSLRAGDTLFELGQPSDSVFLVLSGALVSVFDWAKFPGVNPLQSGRGADAAAATSHTDATKVRIVQAGPGAVMGELDYTLSRPRSFSCLIVSASDVLELERDAFERLSRDEPSLHGLLLHMMLRSSLTQTAHALQKLHNATA